MLGVHPEGGAASRSRRSLVATCLVTRGVKAEVVDVDHYRQRGIMVETDYIIKVESDEAREDAAQFSYHISKTYHQCRKMAADVRKAAALADHAHYHPHTNTNRHGRDDNGAASDQANHGRATRTRVVKFCMELSKIIESQNVTYLRKVNYARVKQMAKQRAKIINKALLYIKTHFPEEDASGFNGVHEMTDAIETFFLTDHVVEEASSTSSFDSSSTHSLPLTSSRQSTPSRHSGISPSRNYAKHTNNGTHHKNTSSGIKLRKTSPIHPISKKVRRSQTERDEHDRILSELGVKSSLLIRETSVGKDFYPHESHMLRLPTITSALKYLAYTLVFVVLLRFLGRLAQTSVTLPSDLALLICFAFFCLGRMGMVQLRSGVVLQVTGRNNSRQITVSPAVLERAVEKAAGGASHMLRKSLRASAIDHVFDGKTLSSPLDRHMHEDDENCWSEPVARIMRVRGATYLSDGKKVPSATVMLPTRGVDIFLTDDAPEDIGRYPQILGGVLRKVPTLVVNFRLPWASLVTYHEIPPKFLPFLQARRKKGGDGMMNTSELSVAERTVGKFFMGDDAYKNQRLKIIPVVVEGPPVVRATMRGRPAIIGNKLPVKYIYKPPNPEEKKAEYFEIDLDIAALSRARKILSLCRGSTRSLTVDVAFVVQGNQEDELPEQILCGARLHKLDLLNASVLPGLREVDGLDE